MTWKARRCRPATQAPSRAAIRNVTVTSSSTCTSPPAADVGWMPKSDCFTPTLPIAVSALPRTSTWSGTTNGCRTPCNDRSPVTRSSYEPVGSCFPVTSRERKRMLGNFATSSTWGPFIACSTFWASPSGSPWGSTASDLASKVTSTEERERSSKSAATSPWTERAMTSCSCPPAKLARPVFPTWMCTMLVLESMGKARVAAAAGPTQSTSRTQEKRDMEILASGFGAQLARVAPARFAAVPGCSAIRTLPVIGDRHLSRTCTRHRTGPAAAGQPSGPIRTPAAGMEFEGRWSKRRGGPDAKADVLEGRGSGGSWSGGRNRLRHVARARGDAAAQDRAHHRDQEHLPVLRRRLRRHHPYPGGPGEERPAHRRTRGRRSRRAHQSRDALSEGRHPQVRHRQPEPHPHAEGPATRVRSLGRHLLGRRRAADREAHQDL